MKKNSAARNERRLKKKQFRKENANMLKNNQCWNELELLHGATVGLLFSTKNITPILRNEALMAKMDSKEVARLAQVISNDLSYFKTKLEAVYEKHKGKTGGSEDPDVLLTSMMIGQEYFELTDSFNTVVLPNVERILNMAKEAAEQLDSEKTAEATAAIAEAETPTADVEEIKND